MARQGARRSLEAWFPGENGGTAIARVLFGDAEPGGRLPATFPSREADEPTAGDPEKYPGVGETVKYKEDVLIGYRWFDEQGKDVAFPFGYGLCLHDVRLLRPAARAVGDATRSSSRVVKNTGKRAGIAVPQLYVGMPEPRGGDVQPPWQLKGFDKLQLAPGKSRRVRFTLDDRAFSYWAGQRLATWRRAATGSASAPTRATCRSRASSAAARSARAGCSSRRARPPASAPRAGRSASTCPARSGAPASASPASASAPCAARGG